MKIVADNNIPYIKGVLEPYAEVVYLRGADITSGDLADADVLLTRTRTKCDASLLGGTQVKLIATATIGTDHIDLGWCAANGIEVASAAGSNAGGVLQWVSAALALLSEREQWMPKQKTIGVVGVGNVGSLVERYARLWGFNVLCSDPLREASEGLGAKEGFVSLDELASTADIVTFHTPLTCSGEHPTHYLGGEDFFSALKRGATVINTSRGGVVDEKVLKREMRRNDIRCCIDTWENEPRIDVELLNAAVLATPHIAGYSAQGKANASAMIIDAVAKRFLLPINNWYPAEVSPIVRRDISWGEMVDSVAAHFDIVQESELLRKNVDKFESFRENSIFRDEYF